MKRPDKKELQLFLVSLVFITLLFAMIYTWTNQQAHLSSFHYQFFFDWELKIPKWPHWIFVYMSLNVLLIMPVFFLDSKEILQIATAFVFCTLVAGLIFYLFPAKVIFERSTEGLPNYLNWIYLRIYAVDLPYNSLPSLHVSFSYLAMRAIVSKAKSFKHRGPFLIWFLLIAVSVVVTHQHHVLDIVAGIGLAELAYYLSFKTRLHSLHR
jgi:membrane-associated phospholipid phosphatase